MVWEYICNIMKRIMTTKITSDVAGRMAKLANIPVTPDEEAKLAEGFTTTIAVVEQLNTVDVSRATNAHMTGLENITREDAVDESRTFTQEEALANAKRTHKGYFVVDQVIAQED